MQLFVGKSGRWCIGVSGEQLTVNKFFISDGSWGEITWSPVQSGNFLVPSKCTNHAGTHLKRKKQSQHKNF